MNSFKLALALTATFSVVGIVADYFLKLASKREWPLASWPFAVGLVLYASTAFGWVYVMRHLKLAAVGAVYSVVMLLLLAVVGAVVFGEKLSAREALGLFLAALAIFLMTEPDTAP